jgi:hypothetical protein
MRSDHIRKGVLPRLEHFGNTIGSRGPAIPFTNGPAEGFGDPSADPGDLDSRFTMR